MKAFMDKDFLLETETAKHLFHDYAEKLPIVDYHCHISPQEIYENRRFDDLAQVWLGGENPDGTFAGDHYKWRLMRSNGVSEDYVTGSQPGLDRMRKFSEALELAIGNPMYHWCNLELRKYCADTADVIADLCCERIRSLADDCRWDARQVIPQHSATSGSGDDSPDEGDSPDLPPEWFDVLGDDDD